MRGIAVLLLGALAGCSLYFDDDDGPQGTPLPDAPVMEPPLVLPVCFGAWDESFGTGGVLVADNNVPFMVPHDAVIQADDRVVIVGRPRVPASGFLIVRYMANGTLDPSFNQDGLAVPPIGTGATEVVATAVAVDADGNLVVTGTADGNAVVARVTSSGALDTTFGGSYITLGAGTPFGVAVSEAGVVVAAATSAGNVFLYRRDATGAVDPSFDGDGVVMDLLQPDPQYGEPEFSFTLDAQGRHIVMATPNSGGGASVIRYQASGPRDTTFGASGGAAWPPFSIAAAGGVVAQASGRVLLAATGALVGSLDSPAFVFGMRESGALDSGAGDSSWGAGGLTWLTQGTTTTDVLSNAIDGQFVTGHVGPWFTASRLTPAGFYDGCWLSPVEVGASATAAIDSQGRVTIVGATADERLVLTRLIP